MWTIIAKLCAGVFVAILGVGILISYRHRKAMTRSTGGCSSASPPAERWSRRCARGASSARNSPACAAFVRRVERGRLKGRALAGAASVAAQQPQLLHRQSVQAQSLPHWHARAASRVWSIIVSLLLRLGPSIGLTAF